MGSEIILRPRQQDSIEGLRAGMRAGHKSQILMAGTGSGKTICGAYLIQQALKKQRKSMFVCDRVQLINQTSATFDKYGIRHGVLQAQHWRYRPYENVQVASVQTMMRRGIPEGVDLYLIDEAHTQQKIIRDLIASSPDATFIGLSATPFSKGLAKMYTNVVNTMTTNDLLAEGWLTPLAVYVGKSADLSGVKTNTKGEWAESEVSERNLAIVGDIVTTWEEKTYAHFGGPAKTILFSASVDDGAVLCEKFKAAGYRFEQISYRTPDAEREAIMKDFALSDTSIVGLVSVEALAKGFDQADIKIGVDARPLRKSLSGIIQMIGRLMRADFGATDPNPLTADGRKAAMASSGKAEGVWICHSGNYLRFEADREDIFANGLANLDDGEHDDKVHKDPDEKTVRECLCSKCRAVMPPNESTCQRCGAVRARRSLIEHLPGEMVRYEPNAPLINASTGRALPDWMNDKAKIWRQLCILSNQQKSDPEKARKAALALYKGFYGAWPKGDFVETRSGTVDPRLESKAHAATLQYFKRENAEKKARRREGLRP